MFGGIHQYELESFNSSRDIHRLYGGETMELERFKETLLEFLSDVTTISEKAKTTFIHDDGSWVPNQAPNDYVVLTDFLLVKVQTSTKIPDRPIPTRGKDEETTPTNEVQGGEIYHCIVKFAFFTEKNVYYISATWLNNTAQYLGAMCNSRTSRPGENWVRGHDLPDGYFCRETWERIKNRFVKGEMKALSKYITSGRYMYPQADIEKEVCG